MATKQQLREFLRREYKHERFEGRDNSTWGKDQQGRSYSECIVDSYADDLAKDGVALIGHHESVRGKVVKFDPSLNIVSIT